MKFASYRNTKAVNKIKIEYYIIKMKFYVTKNRILHDKDEILCYKKKKKKWNLER